MKIAFLGDIALVGQFSSSSEKLNYLVKLLDRYDYRIANLESPMTNRTKTLVPKSMHLRANEESVEVLNALKINAVTLANNHCYDYGRKGVDDTCRVLDASGIKWYGIDGKTVTETIDGTRFTLSGFCCLSTNGTGYRRNKSEGINVLTKTAVEEQATRDKLDGAVSVMSIHYGLEHTSYPGMEHIRLFDDLINYNTVIVHGHHPHQVQGIIEKNGSLIAYSLGNALFDRLKSINKQFDVELNKENRKSFVLGVEIDKGSICEYETNGFYIGNDGIVSYDIDSELQNISFSLRNIKNVSSYQNNRLKQYNAVLEKKFGKHNFKWLKSRFNYYSIGAKICTIKNSILYKRVKKDF